MTRSSNSKLRKAPKAPKPISDEEVARFLKHLAAGYRDKRTGNSLLADALIRVAEKIVESPVKREEAPPNEASSGQQPQLAFEVSLPAIEKLNAEEISKFIEDATKTKVQLIELAAVRFGIPSAKLLRLPLEQVRDAVRSSLMHEASLAVITEEAARYGSRRQS